MMEVRKMAKKIELDDEEISAWQRHLAGKEVIKEVGSGIESRHQARKATEAIIRQGEPE